MYGSYNSYGSAFTENFLDNLIGERTLIMKHVEHNTEVFCTRDVERVAKKSFQQQIHNILMHRISPSWDVLANVSYYKISSVAKKEDGSIGFLFKKLITNIL